MHATSRPQLFTSLSGDDRVEEILAKFFLNNMDPTVADKEHLCSLTKKSKDFVNLWFAEKCFVHTSILSINQIPLALLYFKINPKPKLNEIPIISSILKAEKLAVFRWFNTRRDRLRIKSSLKYAFYYSEEEKKKLEKSFKKYCMIKKITIEKMLEIAKEISIDEIKVDNWFKNKRYSSRRKFNLMKKSGKPIPNDLDQFIRERSLKTADDNLPDLGNEQQRHSNNETNPAVQNIPTINNETNLTVQNMSTVNNETNSTVQNMSTINNETNNLFQNNSIMNKAPNQVIQHHSIVNSRPNDVLTSYNPYQFVPVSDNFANTYINQFQNPLNFYHYQLQPIPSLTYFIPQGIPVFNNQFLGMMPPQSYPQPILNANYHLQPNQVFSIANTQQNQTMPAQNTQNQINHNSDQYQI